MPINQESFNNSLYDLLKTRGYDPVPIDSKGKNTQIPEKADIFKFEFKKDDENYGDVWATIDNAKQLVLYYDDDIADSPSTNTSGTQFTDSWYGLLKHLKAWSQRRQLGFELKNKNHLSNDMAQRENMKNKEKLGEGYYPMGKKASYSDNIPQVKMILQHTRQIEEGEKRYHNVAKIFVENAEGERFAIPTNRPGLARVYARHIAEGGTPYDERGKHITSLVEEYTKMASFVRATRNGTFAESAQPLINEGVNYYQNLRETLSKMTGHRGYNNYFESWTPTLMETEDDTSSLNELFVQGKLDPRIESAMPILNRLRKKVNEVNEVKELEEWAEDLISEKMVMGVSTDASASGTVSEGHMKEVDIIINDIINGDVDPYDIMDNPKTPEEKYVSDMLKDRYDEVARDHYLHPDDDFEKILEIVVDELAKTYDKKSEITEGSRESVTSAIIRRLINQHPDIVGKYGPEKIIAAAEDRASGLDDLEEIGTSDVSGWVKEVVDALERGSYDNLREGHEESYEDMSDIELIKLCHQLGIEKSCVKDAEGGLANRDKVISLLKIQDHDEDLDEDLNADQKRVGQLGPTEKAKKISPVLGKPQKQHPFQGKLVGASESVEPTIAKIEEGQEDLDAILRIIKK